MHVREREREYLVTERRWLAVMALPTTNCLAISGTCRVAAVLATSSAFTRTHAHGIESTQRPSIKEDAQRFEAGWGVAYEGRVEASVQKADDLVVPVGHGHCGFLHVCGVRGRGELELDGV
jgi:hypothetical protein